MQKAGHEKNALKYFGCVEKVASFLSPYAERKV
jgi:hypothetical protein